MLLKVFRNLLLVSPASVLFVGCSDQKQKTASEDEIAKGVPAMQVTSTAFKEGAPIPASHGYEDKNQPPPLKWSDVSEGVKSFALICDDPDAPRGTWVHWVLFNIPAERRELPEGVPAQETLDGGARQGKNDFGNLG